MYTSREVKIVYIMVVWGFAYVRKFLTISLPCLLASKNLPSATKAVKSRFLILTTEPDILLIRNHNRFSYLEELLQVDFVAFKPSDNRYLAMSYAHKLASDIALEMQEVAVFLAPDVIISDGSLYNLAKIAQTEVSAVMTTGLRVLEESLIGILKTSVYDKNGALSMRSRDMTRLALENLHPEFEQYIWQSDNFTVSPRLCMWDSPNGDGFLIRAFHLHPLLVNFGRITKESYHKAVLALNSSTIDGDFLGHLLGDWTGIHIIDDSDDFSIYSSTPLEDREPHGMSDSPVKKIDCLRKMAYGAHVNPLHRYFFSKAIRIHTEDIDSQWDALEEETGKLVYSILDLNGDNQLLTLVTQLVPARELLKILVAKVLKKLRLNSLWIRVP